MVVTTGIHQVTAGAVPRDAVTNHAHEWRRVMREMGLRSEIFTERDHIHPTLRGDVLPHTDWDAVAQPGDVAIIHYSIGSPAFEYVLARASRAVLDYHNITPAELLWEDAPGVALECSLGRRELASLVGRVEATAADSSFNAEELARMGFGTATVTGVVRPPLPRAERSRTDDGRLRLLFVGRGAPNKAQHDLILALTALREAGVDAELRLVGTWEGMEAYEDRCRALTARLGMEHHVHFTGSVGDTQLAQEYADADVFVCLSDHEGYCVPAIEAIVAGLPVVAFARGAVPETVGGAGILLPDKAPSIVAEAVLMAMNDPSVRSAMASARPGHLADLAPEAVAARLRAVSEGLL